LSKLIELQGQGFLWLQGVAILMFFGLCFIGGLIAKVPMSAKPPAERITDMWYWLLGPSVRMICRAVVAVMLVVAATALGREISPDLFKGFGPVMNQPDWLLAIEVLLVMDCCTYWTHRLFHTVPFLWRFHAIHHSATKIRWSTAGRSHPVNEIFNYTFAFFPAFLLGFPIGMVLAMVPILAWYAVAAHTDWNVSFGPINRLFASPRFHRWHHTMSSEGGNKNFSNVFALWDWMFGTYYFPEGRKPEVFGLDDGALPENYLQQLASPFRSPEPQSQGTPEPAHAVPASADSVASARSQSTRPARV
jgi:sterol desaturase/sphingolipid hydroxylase (fatty acid hydroxylase superfamily)